MSPTQFYILCLGYVLIALVLIEGKKVKLKSPKSSKSKDGSSAECETYLKKQHVQNFYMKMGLCRRNLSIVCFVKPMHPCFKNVTNFKATAYVKRQLGQCLIETNFTKKRTTQFYIEAKRMKNPNLEGSRSLDDGLEEKHQKGKCLLKYYCHEGALIHVRMNCGSVFISQGQSYNFTREKRVWRAPEKFKDFVYFISKIDVKKDMREVDVTSVRIFGKGTEDDDLDIEVEAEMAKSLSPQRKPKSG